MKKQKIKLNYMCEYCSQKYIISQYAKEHRRHDINLCLKCYDSYISRKPMLDIIPNTLHKGVILNNEIDFDNGIKYLGTNFKTKIYLEGQCHKCLKDFKSRYDKLKSRQIYPFKKLCTKCIREETCKNEKVRKINSKAQLIAQNKPDVKLKNSIKSKRYWSSLSKQDKEKMLKPFVDHNTKIANDPRYAAKLRKSSGICISGKVLINQKWIDFDSGYELLYLNHLDGSDVTIRRCDFVIPYGKFSYNPDFMIITNEYRRIIEIKGYYKNRIKEKEIAAKSYIKTTDIADEYFIIGCDELKNLGILEKTSSAYVWKRIKDIFDGTNIRFSHEKHREIATIGRPRYYKNRKNKKD